MLIVPFPLYSKFACRRSSVAYLQNLKRVFGYVIFHLFFVLVNLNAVNHFSMNCHIFRSRKFLAVCIISFQIRGHMRPSLTEQLNAKVYSEVVLQSDESPSPFFRIYFVYFQFLLHSAPNKPVIFCCW